MTQLKERVFRLKNALKLDNKSELAERLGVSRATLSRYEAKPETAPSEFLRQMSLIESEVSESYQIPEDARDVIKEHMVPYGMRMPAIPPQDGIIDLVKWLLAEKFSKAEAYEMVSKLVNEPGRILSDDDRCSLTAWLLKEIVGRVESYGLAAKLANEAANGNKEAGRRARKILELLEEDD